MFREMRRFKQQMPQDAVDEIMKNNDTGILAVTGDDGYPYTVPVNYYYEPGTILIHCAKNGHKTDAIKRDPKVSFCVVDEDKVMAEDYNTDYVSVVAFGKAKVITDGSRLRELILKIARKYVPMNTDQQHREYAEKTITSLAIIEIDVEHITGKETMARANARKTV